MASLLSTLLLISTLPFRAPLGASAHMEMSWPYPFRSRFDPTITDPDYDNTFPLNSDGSNYPCKGYQNLTSSQIPKATYIAGQQYNLTLTGTATHEGGSCQISLSYDNGQSFKVIKSMIGGCPLKDNWDFTIPSYAPPANDAILAWTWFNLVGNREEYMNCARVEITTQSVQRYRRTAMRRQQSLSSLPDVFACNIGNGCMTIERREVVFPNPGPDVERGTDAVVPDPGIGYTLTTTPTGNAFSTSTVYNTSVPASTAAPSNTTSGFFNTTTTAPFPIRNATSTSFFGPTGVTGTSRPTTTGLTPNTTDVSSTTVLTSLSAFTAVEYTVLTLTYTIPAMPTLSGSTGTSEPTTVTITTTSPISTFITSISPGAFFANSTSSQLNGTTSSSNFTFVSATTTAALFSNVTATATTLTTFFSNLTSTATLTTTLSTFSTLAVNATSTSTSTSTATASTASATLISTSCTPGQFACNSTTSFSQCVSTQSGSTTYIYMGSVAAGTTCVNGSIVRQNAGPCTPNGELQCDGTTSFYICDQGGLVDMGSVAPGTVCVNGTIVSA